MLYFFGAQHIYLYHPLHLRLVANDTQALTIISDYKEQVKKQMKRNKKQAPKLRKVIKDGKIMQILQF